jgi:FkbM family methyltransferase
MKFVNTIKNQASFILRFNCLKSKTLALLNTLVYTILGDYLKLKKIIFPIVKKEFETQITFRGMKFAVRFPSADFSALNETCHKSVYDKPAKPKGIILDLGAHIGTFTVKHALNPSNYIYSFEPAYNSARLLKKNLKLNNLRNVKILKYAVADKTCEKQFRIPEWSNVNPGLYCDTGIKTLVKVYALDDFVKEFKLKKIDFMKIDVEGAEIPLLNGAKNTLKKFKPKLAIETSEFEKIKKMLAPLGYKKFEYGQSYGGMADFNMMYCE